MQSDRSLHVARSFALLGLCSASPALAQLRPALQFSERTAAAGLAHVYSCSPSLQGMCEMTGAVAVGDFDADGWPDLFALGARAARRTRST